MSTHPYFPFFPDAANLVPAPCQFCGISPSIPSIRLDVGSDLDGAVCALCLAKNKAKVVLPKWVTAKLEAGVAHTHPKWSAAQRDDVIRERLDALAHTPPIPWLQENEWPVCGDDFAQFTGEVTQERLLADSGGSLEAAKRVLRQILESTVPEWEQDEDA